MKLEELKVSSLSNPKGIEKAPYFSYIITSGRHGVFQASCHITVSRGGSPVWEKDTEGSRSAYIRYEGPLESRTLYEVTVSVTDNYGETDTVSGTFETGFIAPDGWSGKWVRSTLPVSPAGKGFGLQPPATMFRRMFTCSGKPASARLYCTCHGIYIPYLNGEEIDGRRFAPEHSSYGKVLYYQTYDITPFLKEGANTLSLYVGDGWYHGVKTSPRVEGWERRHAVLYQMELAYPDGRRETVCSDGSEVCSYGPVVSSDLYAGEKYDARLSFGTSASAPAEAVPDGTPSYGYGNLHAQADPGVRCVEEVPVKEIIKTPEGDTVLDFGKVLAGRLSAVIREGSGRTVAFTHTEMLDRDGNFFLTADMPDGGVEQRDEYVSDGTERRYEPLFTYHGFRYVKVEGASDVNASDYTAKAYSSDPGSPASFTCSDDRLSRLYLNIRNSQRSNMFSIPTDCPQREKAGWTGDIAIYARTALRNGDLTAFLCRWLQSVRADQGANGAVPIVVPYDGGYPMSECFFGPMYEEAGTIGAAGWGDCCVDVPFAILRATGNPIPAEENYDVMEKWCSYIISRCALPGKDAAERKNPENEKYLWNRGYQEGDWLVPSLVKERTDADEPATDPIQDQLFQTEYTTQYAVPMYAYRTFAAMELLSHALGYEGKAAYYGAVAERMKQAIREELFSPDGTLPTNLMGAYVLAVSLGLVPKEHKDAVAGHLVRCLEESGGCLDTGFLSTPYLLDAYTNIGRKDLAYSLLYQNKRPGWLYEVEHGATAIWESWNALGKDGNPQKVSFNHYAFGCVDEWIAENICGICCNGYGYGSIKVQPDISCGLSYARRTVKTEYGMLTAAWEIKDGRFMLDCEIPCNTTAEIILPDGTTHPAASGAWHLECPAPAKQKQD